ncbi:flagellar hook-basal body complex protein [Rhodovulum sp. DZ06]|uniref:flagellar hook-basal body complex protein n=1 Tax=Rhodovulum sp. DZ06 TaxID=3425126 RepID=UPI003D349075
MDNAGYVTITRQSGLKQEMRVIANNIANMATTGFRREGAIFAEMVKAVPVEGGSLSMAKAHVRDTFFGQGELSQTGGTFDLAIEGDGFFQVETPRGLRLTRDGSFLRNADGELVTPEGHRVLDAGGAPIFMPPDAKSISVATDGSVSADGVPVTQIGLVAPPDLSAMTREGGVLFNPGGPVAPVEGGVIHQGFIEGADVSPVLELSRMIEVQRAYEAGQALQDREDERIRAVIRTIGQPR